MRKLQTAMALLCAVCLCMAVAASPAENTLPPQVETSAPAAQQKTYFFALGFGRPGNSSNDLMPKWETGQLFLQSYLFTHARDGARAMVAFVEERAYVSSEMQLDQPDGLHEASVQLLGAGRDTTTTNQKYATRFEKFVGGLEQYLPATGEVELWFAETRTPLQATENDAVVQRLVQMLDQNPDLSIHFLFVTDGTEADNGTQRLDACLDMLRPGRVTICELPAAATLPLKLNAGYLKGASQLSIDAGAVEAEAVDEEAYEWRFSYTHQPWGEKSDALLFVSSDVPLKLDTETAWITTAPPETPQSIGSDDPVATATPETTDDPAATATPETTDDTAATVTPETTDDPAATVTPETMDDPAATAAPEGTDDPAATATPETTDDTAATVTPETMDDPAATAAPDGTDDPAATATPETTDDPAATAAPEGTVDPAATATPVPVSGTTVAVLENIAVVYVQDLPAGSYEIHVRFAGRQKESPALTMYPYLLIPDARETYHAWLESENQDVSWKRDEQSLKLYLHNELAGMPSAEQWIPGLSVNGTPLVAQQDFTYEPAGENEQGDLCWNIRLSGSALLPGEATLVPSLSLTGQSGVVLTGDALNVTIENRAPEAQADVPAQYAFINVPGQSVRELTVDAAMLFEDADGDALTFEIVSCETVDPQGKAFDSISKDSLSSDQLALALIDGVVHYSPKAGDQIKTTLGLVATDPYGAVSEEATLVIEQLDFAKLLIRLRMEPVSGGGVTLAGGQATAAIGEGNSLCLELSDDTLVQPLFDCLEQYGLGDFACNVDYTITRVRQDEEEEQETATATVTRQEDGEGMILRIPLPATDVATTYTIRFDSDIQCYGAQLSGLMSNVPDGSITIEVGNRAPKLRDGVEAIQYATCEAQDMFGQAFACSLSQFGADGSMDVSEWFVDEDWAEGKGQPLKYTLTVTDGAQDAVTVTQNEKALPMQENGYTLAEEDPFDVVFTRCGDYEVTVRAFDGDAETVRTIQVSITSLMMRVLLITGVILLVCAALAALILLILWSRKPSFQDLCVGMYITDDLEYAHQPQAMLPLRRYGKKGVSLLELALAAQQPVFSASHARWLRSATLLPANRKALAVLNVGSKTPGATVGCSGSSIRAAGRMPLSSSPVYIRIDNTCTVILTLTRSFNENF